ncbi:hypothetical protein AGMMS49991_02500 [Spirochaetia bacterium]|nr:hypothetical protein AGMMS49991_02500 [Spirochaetia bacterium]
MRKLFYLCGVGLLFASCASMGAKKDFTTVLPAALVGISADGDIRWAGEEKKDPGLLGLVINKAVSNEKNKELSALLSRADGLISDAEAVLLQKLRANNFSLVDKDLVLGSAAYKNAKTAPLAGHADLMQPEGYRFINQRDANFVRSFTAETGAQGTLYVYFNFYKMMVNGVEKNGTMAAMVTMNVLLYDSAGKLFFTKAYTGKGKDTIPVVLGVYDYIRFMNLIPAVIDTVCGVFAAEMLKKVTP